MLRAIVSAILFAASALHAQTPATTAGLTDIDAARINRSTMSPLAVVALAGKSDWKHAETTNFIYHFSERAAADAIATESEFFYRVIARELERDTSQWEHKAHIFVFESDHDWKAFQSRGQLDPRSGGIHSAGSLFLRRRGASILNDETLAHEIAHLVIGRFFGSGVPLWLNEGFAENSAIRCRAAFFRARGYNAKPRFRSVTAETYIPLTELTSLGAYPADTVKMFAFYDQSEKLTRFLMGVDRKNFASLLDGLSKGNRFETALSKSYGSRFISLDAFEKEFRPFATTHIVAANL